MEKRRYRFDSLRCREVKPYWILSVKKLFHNRRVPDWCKMRYPGHPRGCPMYGTREKCPPTAPYVTDIFDISKGLFIVYSEFNVEEYAKGMKKKHPDWSARQCRNCLYWQGKSRNQLKSRVDKAMNILHTNVFTYMPHASGVNVYSTCRCSGLVLEKINLDMKINRHVALLGWDK